LSSGDGYGGGLPLKEKEGKKKKNQAGGEGEGNIFSYKSKKKTFPSSGKIHLAESKHGGRKRRLASVKRKKGTVTTLPICPPFKLRPRREGKEDSLSSEMEWRERPS